MHCHSVTILLATQISLFTVRGADKGHEHQEVRLIQGPSWRLAAKVLLMRIIIINTDTPRLVMVQLTIFLLYDCAKESVL